MGCKEMFEEWEYHLKMLKAHVKHLEKLRIKIAKHGFFKD